MKSSGKTWIQIVKQESKEQGGKWELKRIITETNKRDVFRV